MNLPAEGWADLRRAGKGDGKLEIPSIPSTVQTGYGLIRFSLGPRGEPRLLVPCATTRARVTAEPTDKLGLDVRSYSGPDGRQAYIDIICHDVALENVFSELASEVLRRVEGGGGPEASVTGAIDDFRSLLSRASSDAPTRAEVLGLIGELYLLSQFVALDAGGVALWLGPWEQRHDFRSAGMAIEVKTSGRSDTSRVSVHGADQLQTPRAGSLVLVRLRLEEGAGAPLSVGSLYDAVAESSKGGERLREGLHLLGCADPHDPLWNRYRFSLEAQDAWEVREGFPRVSPAEFPGGVLPPGISNVEYTLDLSVADAYRMNLKDLEKYMQRMCHGQAEALQ